MKGLLTKIKRSFKKRSKKRKGQNFFGIKEKLRNTKVQSTRYKNIPVLSLLLVSLILIITWFFSSLYKLTTTEFYPAYRDTKDEEEQVWKGESRINILFVGLDRRENEYGFADALFVVMVDPTDHSLGIFNINPDTVVFIQNDNKTLRGLYNQGILENEEAPIDVLTSGVETLMSIKINRYILVDEEGLVKITDVLGGVYISNSSYAEDKDIPSEGGVFSLDEGNFRLKSSDFLDFCRIDDDGAEKKLERQINCMQGLMKRSVSYIAVIKLPLILDVFSSELQTDMTNPELMRTAYAISSADEMKTSFMGSTSTQETDNGMIPVYEELDQDIQTVFIDSRIGKEQARVEVFNSTNIKGLAAFRARWLRNIGVDVIRVGDSAEEHEKTTIYTREKEIYKNTIEAVKKSFDEEITVLDGKLPDFICTGDVIIVLGKNIETE